MMIMIIIIIMILIMDIGAPNLKYIALSAYKSNTYIYFDICRLPAGFFRKNPTGKRQVICLLLYCT